MITVVCLEDGREYGMDARTAYEALSKMKYTLDLEHRDNNAVINKTESGLHLWMEHSGKTYAAWNK